MIIPRFDYTCEVCGHQDRAYRSEKPPRFCSRKCWSKGMAGRSTKKVKYVITPEMHERIKAVYQNITGSGQVRDLAQALGLPRWKVSKYAQKQGWLAKTSKTPDWSEREIAILDKASYLSPERIQARLKKAGFNRSLTAIVLKRKRMRFLQNLDGQSARSVAECFGIDSHSVKKWIQKGWLKAKKRGTNRTRRQGGDHWYIKDKWIREFVIHSVDLIDFRKVDKYWLVDLLVGGQNGTGPAKTVKIEGVTEKEEMDDFSYHQAALMDPDIPETFHEEQERYGAPDFLD